MSSWYWLPKVCKDLVYMNTYTPAICKDCWTVSLYYDKRLRKYIRFGLIKDLFRIVFMERLELIKITKNKFENIFPNEIIFLICDYAALKLRIYEFEIEYGLLKPCIFYEAKELMYGKWFHRHRIIKEILTKYVLNKTPFITFLMFNSTIFISTFYTGEETSFNNVLIGKSRHIILTNKYIERFYTKKKIKEEKEEEERAKELQRYLNDTLEEINFTSPASQESQAIPESGSESYESDSDRSCSDYSLSSRCKRYIERRK